MCGTTQTRHLNRLGQLSEVEQESNDDSQQEVVRVCAHSGGRAGEVRTATLTRSWKATQTRTARKVCVPTQAAELVRAHLVEEVERGLRLAEQ